MIFLCFRRRRIVVQLGLCRILCLLVQRIGDRRFLGGATPILKFFLFCFSCSISCFAFSMLESFETTTTSQSDASVASGVKSLYVSLLWPSRLFVMSKLELIAST